MPKPTTITKTTTTTKTTVVAPAPTSEKNKKAAKAQPKIIKKEKIVEEVIEEAADQDYEEENDDLEEADKGNFQNFDDDEDDDEDEEIIGDDDIYIPKKKAKISQTREKVTKGAQRTTTDAPTKKSKSQNKTEETKTDETEGQVEKTKKTKADRFSKKEKDLDNSHRGILMVSHLPYGFVEEALKEYFGAYGDILNVNLARSKTTGRAKGYAFIEYRFKEVAKIAAESMNGYLVYGKKLECKVIEDDEGVKVKSKKLKYIPYNKIFIEQKNKTKTNTELAKEIRNLVKSEEKKRQSFTTKGIEYDFPGFSAILSQADGAN